MLEKNIQFRVLTCPETSGLNKVKRKQIYKKESKAKLSFFSSLSLHVICIFILNSPSAQHKFNQTMFIWISVTTFSKHMKKTPEDTGKALEL